MKWLITGTRHGRRDVGTVLDGMVLTHGEPTMVVAGDAGGVDMAAHEWGVRRGTPSKAFFAEWERFGRKAGPLRNQEMVDFCEPGDLCIAFPAADSVGTKDCYARAIRAGLLGEWVDPS